MYCPFWEILFQNIGVYFTQIIIFFLFLKYSIYTFLIVANHAYGPSGHQLRHLGCCKLSTASKPLAQIPSGWLHGPPCGAFYVAVDAAADMSMNPMHICMHDPCVPARPSTWWLLPAWWAAETTVHESGLVAVRMLLN